MSRIKAIAAAAMMMGVQAMNKIGAQNVGESMAPNGKPWKRPIAQVAGNKSPANRGSNARTKRMARKARNVARNRRAHRG